MSDLFDRSFVGMVFRELLTSIEFAMQLTRTPILLTFYLFSARFVDGSSSFLGGEADPTLDHIDLASEQALPLPSSSLELWEKRNLFAIAHRLSPTRYFREKGALQGRLCDFKDETEIETILQAIFFGLEKEIHNPVMALQVNRLLREGMGICATLYHRSLPTRDFIFRYYSRSLQQIKALPDFERAADINQVEILRFIDLLTLTLEEDSEVALSPSQRDLLWIMVDTIFNPELQTARTVRMNRNNAWERYEYFQARKGVVETDDNRDLLWTQPLTHSLFLEMSHEVQDQYFEHFTTWMKAANKLSSVHPYWCYVVRKHLYGIIWENENQRIVKGAFENQDKSGALTLISFLPAGISPHRDSDRIYGEEPINKEILEILPVTERYKINVFFPTELVALTLTLKKNTLFQLFFLQNHPNTEIKARSGRLLKRYQHLPKGHPFYFKADEKLLEDENEEKEEEESESVDVNESSTDTVVESFIDASERPIVMDRDTLCLLEEESEESEYEEESEESEYEEEWLETDLPIPSKQEKIFTFRILDPVKRARIRTLFEKRIIAFKSRTDLDEEQKKKSLSHLWAYYMLGEFYLDIIETNPIEEWVHLSLKEDFSAPAIKQKKYLALEQFEAIVAAGERQYGLDKMTTCYLQLLMRCVKNESLGIEDINDLLIALPYLEEKGIFLPIDQFDKKALVDQYLWQLMAEQGEERFYSERIRVERQRAKKYCGTQLFLLDRWMKFLIHHDQRTMHKMLLLISKVKEKALFLHRFFLTQEEGEEEEAWLHRYAISVIEHGWREQIEAIGSHQKIFSLFRHVPSLDEDDLHHLDQQQRELLPVVDKMLASFTSSQAKISFACALVELFKKEVGVQHTSLKFFTDALQLLQDYDLPQANYKEVIKLLYPDRRCIELNKWAKKIFAFLSKYTFESAIERDLEEILEEIIKSAPDLENTQPEYLRRAYIAILKAYKNPSRYFFIDDEPSTFSEGRKRSKHPISKWSKSDIRNWARKCKSKYSSRDSDKATASDDARDIGKVVEESSGVAAFFSHIVEHLGASPLLHSVIGESGEKSATSIEPAPDSKSIDDEEVLYEMIAVIQRTVKLEYGYEPRIVQILSVILLYQTENGKGRLAQIATGEGKSLIVAMLAVLEALHGKKVDIITSSTELSTREAVEQAPFFDYFDLSVGENSGELAVEALLKQRKLEMLIPFAGFKPCTPEEKDRVRKAAKIDAYQKDILFGTTSEHLFDLMRDLNRSVKKKKEDDEEENPRTRTARPTDVCYVDEVDHMFVGNRGFSARLSSPTPYMEKLLPFLSMIWHHVTASAEKIVEIDGEYYYCCSVPQEIKEEEGEKKEASAKESASQPRVTPVDDEDEKKYPNEEESSDPTEEKIPIEDRDQFLEDMLLPSIAHKFRELTEKERKAWQEKNEMESTLSKLAQIKNQLKQKLEIAEKSVKKSVRGKTPEEIKREIGGIEDEIKTCEEAYANCTWTQEKYENFFTLPNHLKGYMRKELPKFIKNAIHAYYYFHQEVQYDIIDGKVVPIDYSGSGVIQHGMVWSHGLAQFVAMKEGLTIEPLSLMTTFASYIFHYKMYDKCCGLTGTLGDQAARNYLREVYNVDFVDIPPFKKQKIRNNKGSPYRCKELKPYIVDDHERWVQHTIQDVVMRTKLGQPVLLLCPHIRAVKIFENRLKLAFIHHRLDFTKIFIYTGQEAFDKRKIAGNEVIIATNIAGRGMDVNPVPSVFAMPGNGLHVALTFLPPNLRVEMQNAGRTGRKGAPGTTKLYLLEEKVKSLAELKKERNAKNKEAMEKAIEEAQALAFKDQLFALFQLFLERRYSAERVAEAIEEQKNEAEIQFIMEMITSSVEEELQKHGISTTIDTEKTVEKTIEAAIDSHEEAYPEGNDEKSDEEEKERRRQEEAEINRLKRLRHTAAWKKLIKKESADYDKALDNGYFVREGLKERWGLFLVDIEDLLEERKLEEVEKQFIQFINTVSDDIKEGNGIKNPYYLMQELANRVKSENYVPYLDEKKKELCRKIIALDPVLSVYARNELIALRYKELSFLSWGNTAIKKEVLQLLRDNLQLMNGELIPSLFAYKALLSMNPKIKNESLIKIIDQELAVLYLINNISTQSLISLETKMVEEGLIRKEDYLPRPTNGISLSSEQIDIKKELDKSKTPFTDEEFIALLKYINGARELHVEVLALGVLPPISSYDVGRVALWGAAQLSIAMAINLYTGGAGSALTSIMVQQGTGNLFQALNLCYSREEIHHSLFQQNMMGYAMGFLSLGVGHVIREGFTLAEVSKYMPLADDTATNPLTSTFRKRLLRMGVDSESQEIVNTILKQTGYLIAKSGAQQLVNAAADSAVSKLMEKTITSFVKTQIKKNVLHELKKITLIGKMLSIDQHHQNRVHEIALGQLIQDVIIEYEHGKLSLFTSYLTSLIDIIDQEYGSYDAEKRATDPMSTGKPYQILSTLYQAGHLGKALYDALSTSKFSAIEGIISAIRHKVRSKKEEVNSAIRRSTEEGDTPLEILDSKDAKLEILFENLSEIIVNYVAQSFHQVVQQRLATPVVRKLIDPWTSGLFQEKLKALQQELYELKEKRSTGELNRQIEQLKKKKKKEGVDFKEKEIDIADDLFEEGGSSRKEELEDIAQTQKMRIILYDEDGKEVVYGKEYEESGETVRISKKKEKGVDKWECDGEKKDSFFDFFCEDQESKTELKREILKVRIEKAYERKVTDIKHGGEGDITELNAIASIEGKPIYIYEGEKLVKVVGAEYKGTPKEIIFHPGDDKHPASWSRKGDSKARDDKYIGNTLFDCFADSAEAGETLRQKACDYLRKNPEVLKDHLPRLEGVRARESRKADSKNNVYVRGRSFAELLPKMSDRELGIRNERTHAEIDTMQGGERSKLVEEIEALEKEAKKYRNVLDCLYMDAFDPYGGFVSYSEIEEYEKKLAHVTAKRIQKKARIQLLCKEELEKNPFVVALGIRNAVAYIGNKEDLDSYEELRYRAGAIVKCALIYDNPIFLFAIAIGVMDSPSSDWEKANAVKKRKDTLRKENVKILGEIQKLQRQLGLPIEATLSEKTVVGLFAAMEAVAPAVGHMVIDAALYGTPLAPIKFLYDGVMITKAGYDFVQAGGIDIVYKGVANGLSCIMDPDRYYADRKAYRESEAGQAELRAKAESYFFDAHNYSLQEPKFYGTMVGAVVGIGLASSTKLQNVLRHNRVAKALQGGISRGCHFVGTKAGILREVKFSKEQLQKMLKGVRKDLQKVGRDLKEVTDSSLSSKGVADEAKFLTVIEKNPELGSEIVRKFEVVEVVEKQLKPLAKGVVAEVEAGCQSGEEIIAFINRRIGSVKRESVLLSFERTARQNLGFSLKEKNVDLLNTMLKGGKIAKSELSTIEGQKKMLGSILEISSRKDRAKALMLFFDTSHEAKTMFGQVSKNFGQVVLQDAQVIGKYARLNPTEFSALTQEISNSFTYGKYGVDSYPRLKKMIAQNPSLFATHEVEVHHILMKRFSDRAFMTETYMPSIILTKAEHDKITQATNKIFKLSRNRMTNKDQVKLTLKGAPTQTLAYTDLTNAQILEGLKTVYKEYPELLALCKKMLNTSPVK